MSTFVLIHGGFHGGWCWRRVREILQRDGHTVFTPSLPGAGEHAHAYNDAIGLETWVRDVANLLVYEDLREVVLVGHSLSGSAIPAVAARERERIRHLVFFDSLLVEPGHSVLDGMPPDAAAQRRAMAAAGGGELLLPIDPAAFGLSRPDEIAWVAERLTPQPFSIFTDRLEYDAERLAGLRTTYVACTRPLYPGTANAREVARSRKGWGYVEFDAPHDAMIEEPVRTADLLVQLSGDA